MWRIINRTERPVITDNNKCFNKDIDYEIYWENSRELSNELRMHDIAGRWSFSTKIIAIKTSHMNILQTYVLSF